MGTHIIASQGVLNMEQQKCDSVGKISREINGKNATFGIRSLQVTPLQIPSKENGEMAVCQATLTTKDGNVFQDIGDASPDNIPAGCQDSLLQLASNRSKTSVLNDACIIYNAVSNIINSNSNIIETTALPTVNVQHTSPFKAEDVPGRSKKKGNPITDKQIKLLNTTARYNNKTPDDIEKVAMDLYGRSISNLTTKEVNPILDKLKG